MVAITTDRVLTLDDGRVLGFAEFGAPSGYPIFFFHGVPGSRLSAMMAGLVGGVHDARVVAIDRPGYGLSDFVPGRRIGDWPRDVEAVAEHLGIERFAVFGYSGGGPYALATAAALPAQVTGATVVSGMGPVGDRETRQRLTRQERLQVLVARYGQWAVRLGMHRAHAALRADPHGFLARRMAGSPPSDLAAAGRPEIRAVMERDLLAAWRSGTRGAALDISLLARPWDFDLSSVEAPARIWHGSADTVVPAWLGEAVAERLPHADFRLVPGGGHLLFLDRMDEILDGLLAIASPEGSHWRGLAERHEAQRRATAPEPAPGGGSRAA